MAQQQSDRFVAEVFAIDGFKINSTLQDIQKDKKTAENLSFFYKEDNEAVYFLADQQINLPGLKPLDRLEFDTLRLTFENNRLHDIDLRVPGRFKDMIFAKTYNEFNTKYGRAAISDEKNKIYKKYVWNLGTNEIIIDTYSEGFMIHYANKISTRKIGWVYNERKGKGDGTIELKLPYFEKLLRKKLSVGQFEKFLPQWETTGNLNHIYYELNFKTMADNSSKFSITYSLNNYAITVKTDDTTSKIISEFTIEKIKDSNVWTQFQKDLENLNYKVRPKFKYNNIISYSNRKITVFLDKEDSRITIIAISNIFLN